MSLLAYQDHPWSEDFNHAWQAVIPKIEVKFELEEKHLYPLVLFVCTAVFYFRLKKIMDSGDKESPVYPTGLVPDLQCHLDDYFSIARTAAAEFFIIPKTALRLTERDDLGYDIDLVRIFNWKERR